MVAGEAVGVYIQTLALECCQLASRWGKHVRVELLDFYLRRLSPEGRWRDMRESCFQYSIEEGYLSDERSK